MNMKLSKEKVITLIREELERDIIDLKRKLFLPFDNTDNEYFKNPYKSGIYSITDKCITIEVNSDADFKKWYYENFDFEDLIPQELSAIRDLYSIKDEAGKFIALRDIYSYEEFIELFYDDYVEITEHLLDKYNEDLQTDIQNEVFKLIYEYLLKEINIIFEDKHFKVKASGEMLSDVINKTDDITKNDITDYLNKIARRIAEKAMECKPYTICVNIDSNISIEIDEAGKVVFIPIGA